MNSSNKISEFLFIVVFAIAYLGLLGCFILACFQQKVDSFKERITNYVDSELDQEWKFLSAWGKIRMFFMFIFFALISIIAGAVAGGILAMILRAILSLTIYQY